MECPECGTEFEGGNFCPECGLKNYPNTEHQMSWIDRQKATWAIFDDVSENKSTKIELNDDILDFKAVTIMTALTLFITFVLYSYTPNYAFIIGCFGGGFISGGLFKNKLTTKTGMISLFVGFMIALVLYAILMSY